MFRALAGQFCPAGLPYHVCFNVFTAQELSHWMRIEKLCGSVVLFCRELSCGPGWRQKCFGCLVFSDWCLVFGVWCLVFGVGVWCLVFGVGVRCSVFGVWCLVFGQKERRDNFVLPVCHRRDGGTHAYDYICTLCRL